MRGGDFWSSLDFRVNEDIFHLCSPSLLGESLFLSPAWGGSCGSSGLSSFVALGAGGCQPKIQVILGVRGGEQPDFQQVLPFSPLSTGKMPWPPKPPPGHGPPPQMPSPRPAPCLPLRVPGTDPMGPHPSPTLPLSSQLLAATGDPTGLGDAPLPPTGPPGTPRSPLPLQGGCPLPAWHGQVPSLSWCQHRAGPAPWCDPPNNGMSPSDISPCPLLGAFFHFFFFF